MTVVECSRCPWAFISNGGEVGPIVALRAHVLAAHGHLGVDVFRVLK